MRCGRKRLFFWSSVTGRAGAAAGGGCGRAGCGAAQEVGWGVGGGAGEGGGGWGVGGGGARLPQTADGVHGFVSAVRQQVEALTERAEMVHVPAAEVGAGPGDLRE